MNSPAGITFGAISAQNIEIKNFAQDSWRFHSFEIEPKNPSWRGIVDSAFGTPARYVQEMYIRLTEVADESQPARIFVFNPLFATTRATILTVVAMLQDTVGLSGPAVIADQDGLPVGYLLPENFLLDDSRYLSLLSAIDMALDATLLELLCCSKTVVISAPRLCLSKHWRSGFEDFGLRPVYSWITQHAISLLLANPDSHPEQIAPEVAKKHRDSIPFAAIMPNHAGDVLFFALAFNEITTHCRRIAVNKAYADIVLNAAPLLHVICIDAQQVNRDAAFASGNAVRDSEYFHSYKDSLPQENFYTYCRPSRNYNTTEFHLIDHFAFALGHSPRDRQTLLIRSRQMPQRLSQPQASDTSARILLHFDGGWPLKVYPLYMQGQLIDLLLLRGYKVTVLAPLGYSYPGVESTTFRSLNSFVKLALAHDLIVGMDSFPSHYSAHVMGLPTLCLFASTKPANSNALPSNHYAYLEKGLGCRPCYAVAECPVYGGNSCRNFVEPQAVINQIERLLAGKTNLTMNQCNEPLIAAEYRRTIDIDMRYVGLQARVATITPPFSYWTTLLREFKNAIQREGLLPAICRSGRFLAKRYRSDRV